jgi:AraC family transcriptional regulator of adaptative response / DNA-3-methyladenine glycosylase II
VDHDPAPTRLTLGYVAPYDWAAIIEFLLARAIPGVEVVDPDRYRRTFEIDGQQGIVDVAPAADRDALALTIRSATAHSNAVETIVARVSRLFDIAADVRAIAAHFAADELLAPLVAARPGLRVPGAWDGFELSVRAILGQQITVAGARALAGKLVAAHGTPLGVTTDPGLTTLFPRPEAMAGADVASIGMPAARARSLSSLGAAAANDPRLFELGGGLEASLARLTALPGIGEWTAQYIALRALREPDAFPAADIGLLRAMAGRDGIRPTPAELLARAEAWRPWRAYAAQHLWTSRGVLQRHEQEAVA